MTNIIIVTTISFVLSILIVIIHNVFKVRVSKKQKEILDLLPGYNCGACGYASCEGMCKALLEDGTVIDKCKIIEEDKLKSIIKILK